jgi:chromosome segregation ATPase
MHFAALRLQSYVRMAHQRRAYKRELQEKKEEAKLSNQLAKLQARLQAEMAAREQAEVEQERLKAGMVVGALPPPPPPGRPSAVGASSPSESPPLDNPLALGARLGAAAGKLFSGYLQGQSSSSVEETATMLAAVSRDREKLSGRLAAEADARKRLEAEKRELESKLRLGSTTSDFNSRKAQGVQHKLTRQKEELAEMRTMLQQQTIEIGNLHAAARTRDKRMVDLEKKLWQYDDSFYSLEARNVRDRTRMEEMGKAKAKAEAERSVCRFMLEQVHERGLQERQELRKDAQAKLDASAHRNRTKKRRISLLEKELREKAQIEEEKKAYKEQCAALMEQCSSLMEQLRAAHGADVEMPAPRSASDSTTSPPGGGSFMDRVRSGIRHASEAAKG